MGFWNIAPCSLVEVDRRFRAVLLHSLHSKGKGKAVSLYTMEALGGRGDIAPTHS
jgi:hypothetical protein